MAHQFHLADLFETVAATVPDRMAVIDSSKSLTFRQLDDRATRLAAGMAARGIGRGDTIGLYMANRIEHIEAFIAAVKIGAVPFNVNFRYREEELLYLFENAATAAIVHDAQYGEILQNVLPKLSGFKLAVAVDDRTGAATASSVAYDDLLETVPAGPWPRSEDDVLLTYTGGTTGMPKGVMWPHRAFFFACAGGAGYFNPHGPAQSPEDIADRAANGYLMKMLPVAPLMHGAALWAVWSTMLNGVTVVLDDGPRFEPEKIWSLIERHQINLVQIVGDAMAIPLRDALQVHPGRWDLSSLVNFGSGGAVFSRHVQDDLRSLLPSSANITDGMGSSETGMSGLAQPSTEGLMQLVAGADQKVIIGDMFAEPGETGLVARSGNTPIGYFGDPAKTAETFKVIDGRLWAISGDTARLEADGTITVFGRGSTCINSGGEKIFPEEVEEALRAYPAINDAVVVGLPDARWGERVVAVFSLRDTAVDLDEDALRTFLRERLAGYKVPKTFVEVEQVRRSAAGKQDYPWAKEVAQQHQG